MAGSGRDIPALELEVLGALWRIEQGTVREVLEELRSGGRRLAYTTVLTLLGRLEARGYVARTRRAGTAHLYRPRISRERVMASRVGAMVRQFGAADAVPLIVQLVQAQKLSAEDIRQLRELLERLEAEAS